jgi:hypothetical protein
VSDHQVGNRAARRQAISERRRRRVRHARKILRFHRASKGALETYIIAAADYPKLAVLAATGDEAAGALVTAIGIWISEAERREEATPDETFLCLDCNTTFGPSTNAPVAFAVWMPFADHEHSIVTGICQACANKGEDLQTMALRRLRSIWPDAYSIGSQAGQA